MDNWFLTPSQISEKLFSEGQSLFKKKKRKEKKTN